VDASGDSVSSSVGLRRSGGFRKGDVMKYRVIQWGTGFVGKLALGATIEHPDLELVGLVVHGEDKVGRDAGELIGRDPVGVTATNDVAAAAKIDADVVSYFANADMRPVEAVQDMARMLAAGKNVVSSSVVALVYPKSAPPGLVAPLESACREGGTSCFTTGIDPGFCNDLIPMTLMGLCSRVDAVRIQEVLDYSTYPNPETLFNIMGFGQPLGTTPLLLTPGALSLAWGSVIHMLADGLDVKLDEVREVHERRPAPRTLTLDVGTVEKGTSAALRFELQGIVAGEPKIVVEHVTRMHPEMAPDWPQLEDGDGYRIFIEGNPSITTEIGFRGEDGDANTGGCLSTAVRALAAIPAVCAAEPGLVTPFDLPLLPGTHSMR
jgi:4-hydroxy-tetrahydrodipicolinate reductase